jgi:hypothetical protein
MLKTAILGAALALVIAAPAPADEAPAAGLMLADAIPPNCLMDPFTHKLVCTKTRRIRTIDPLTGKIT